MPKCLINLWEELRSLFNDAEKYPNKLSVIIIDEIDALCRERGSSNNSYGDSAVDQLLAKMDGVKQLDNVLMIGMTNRIDVIDQAILRPGRFEVHIEIPLPDEKGIREIFDIHTKALMENHRMSGDINSDQICKRMLGYSGAEIMGVVRAATQYAMKKQFDMTTVKFLDESKIIVTNDDFDKAIKVVKPNQQMNLEEMHRIALQSQPNGKTISLSGHNCVVGLNNIASYYSAIEHMNIRFRYISDYSMRDNVSSITRVKKLMEESTIAKTRGELLVIHDVTSLIDYIPNEGYSRDILRAIRLIFNDDEMNVTLTFLKMDSYLKNLLKSVLSTVTDDINSL